MSSKVVCVVDEKKGTLTITLPLEPKKSASGKSTVIASTRGNMAVDAKYKGETVTIGVTAYVKD